jgi:putative sterol carrier protein
MLSIQKGEDLLSITLNNILSFRKDEEEFISLVVDWNKNIIIEILDFYLIEVIFKGNQITFKTNNFDKKIHLKVQLDLQTFLDIAYLRINPISAVLKRRLKIKGILKIRTLLKFMKIFLKSMKMVAANPNLYYYEQNKKTR